MARSKSQTTSKIHKHSKSITTGILFLLLLVIPTVIIGQNRQDIRQRAATSAPIHPTGTYTDWNWPANPKGYTTFVWQVTPLVDPTPAGYFWAHQYGFKNGDGGYTGLQSQGSRRKDGSIGKLAIFSLWDTTVSQGPACGNFSGEGIGQSCSIAYDWIAGRTYSLRVARMSADSTGTWWGSWVKDTVTQTETFIGQIKLPLAWGKLNEWSVVWTENFAPSITDCSQLIHSSVRFGTPIADGNVRPSSRLNHLSNPPGCPGSSITNVPAGVQQDMGAGSGGIKQLIPSPSPTRSLRAR